MNTNNNFHFSTTNSLNFLTQGIRNGPSHSRSISTNRRMKFSNTLLSKRSPNSFNYSQENNPYMQPAEIYKREKLQKLINVSRTTLKETPYDFIITFEDNPIPKPHENNRKIYNKYLDKDTNKNKSSFDYPSIITNSLANSKVISNTRIGDFISSYETPLYPPIENFPKAELRRREKIKNKFEKSYNSMIEPNNNLKILNQKFDEHQSFQESELLKNKMGVENIVKEEVDEQIYDDELNVSRDEEELVNHIYEKVKQSHLKKNEKYKIINEELKIDKKNKDIAEGEFKELYRLNLRSYERFLKN